MVRRSRARGRDERDLLPPGPRCRAAVHWASEISGAPLLREDVAMLCGWRLILAAITERVPPGPIPDGSSLGHFSIAWAVEATTKHLRAADGTVRLHLEPGPPSIFPLRGSDVLSRVEQACAVTSAWATSMFRHRDPGTPRRTAIQSRWCKFYTSEGAAWGPELSKRAFATVATTKGLSLGKLFKDAVRSGEVRRGPQADDDFFLHLMACVETCGSRFVRTADGRLIFNLAAALDQARPSRRRRSERFSASFQPLSALPSNDEGEEGAGEGPLDALIAASRLVHGSASSPPHAELELRDGMEAARLLVARIEIVARGAVGRGAAWDALCDHAGALYLVWLQGELGRTPPRRESVGALARRLRLNPSLMRRQWRRLRDGVLRRDPAARELETRFLDSILGL